jgi:uncharacterized protein YbjT (DUF2867 family)
MILVTGATGTIGRELVQDLQARKVKFKVMVRRAEACAAFEAQGIQPVIGDFSHPGTFPAVLAGATEVFLLTTPSPDQVRQEGAFLAACGKAGVRRIVRLSAQGANPWSASPLTRSHGLCEAQLEASGMAWTILRPTMFMQNLAPMYGESVAETSTFFAPAGDARIPWVDVRDIAALAAVTLTSEGHEGLVYELTGPQLHTYAGVAELLSAQLGRGVKFVDVPDDAACQSMANHGMSAWLAHSITTLFHQFRANAGTAVVLGTVQRITGRPARTLEAYLQENLNIFKGVRAASMARVSTPTTR